MAEFSRHIPSAIESEDHLSELLGFWNEKVCREEMQGRSYIYCVVLDVDDNGQDQNVVWFKDAIAAPIPPRKVIALDLTLSEAQRKQTIDSLVAAENLIERSSAVVRFGTDEKKWVVFLDSADTASQKEPEVIAPAIVAPTGNAAGTITTDHWLTTAKRRPLLGGSPYVPQFIVIHYTEGFKAETSITGWKNKNDGVLAHVVVDRDGAIYQCRPFDQTCMHAGRPGKSRTQDPKTGKPFDGLNSFAIGIEIANTGMQANLHLKLGRGGPYPSGTTIPASHRNGSKGSDEAKNGKQWEVYPPAQIKSVFDLVSLLVAKYDILDITGHDCISPERKADPGPAFPMLELRKANHFAGLPKVWDTSGNEIKV